MQKNSTVYDRLYTIMRITLLQGIVVMVFSGLAVAHDNHAQTILDKEVSLKVSEVSLDKALAQISSELKIRFVYSPLATFDEKVSLDVTNQKLGSILETLLEPRGLVYSLDKEGDYIILKERKQIKHGELNSLPQSSLSIPLTGVVRDKNGTPIPGVSVIVKGSRNGAITDSDGKYSIDVNEGDVLVFSFVGYKKVEEEVNGRSTIDLILEEDATTLNEVIINGGYYKTTDKEKTGSIVKIGSEDIERQPVVSPLMALQGRVPGLEVTPANGMPGNAPKIRIRGENSLRPTGGYPLYIVDGMQLDSRPLETYNGAFIQMLDPLSTISPSNIESIEILKDADATAIYGSRGANGVILITTKSGRKANGRTNFDFNMYKGVGQIANRLDLLNTQEYLSMRHEAFRNDGVTLDEFNAPDLLLWDTTRYTDWQDVLIGGTSNITDIQANISGGNANTSFRFGGGYHKETLVFPGDFYSQQASASLGVNHTSTDKKFGIYFSVNYGRNVTKVFTDLDMMSYALGLAPNSPSIYNEDGTLNWELNESGSRTWLNPFSSLKKTQDNVTNNLVANSVVSYSIWNDLTVKMNMGFTQLRNRELTKVPFSSMTPEEAETSTAQNTFGDNNRQSWMLEPQLDFSKSVNKHSFTAVLGSTWQASSSEYQAILAEGYTSDEFLGALQWAATYRIQREGVNEYKYNSVFARIGYNYAGRYLLNVTARRDGSSRFGPNNRFGNFGAIGAGWIFTNEQFMSSSHEILSFGKIRASYGVTGNDQIGDYQYYNYYVRTFLKYDGNISIAPGALFNPNYQWERTKKLEMGIELEFLKSRIALEGMFYRNRSDNQLVEYALPATTGFPTVLENFGAVVQNQGIELVMKTQNIVKKDFSWNTTLNISIPNNKLVEFEGIEESAYALIYSVGNPLSIRRLFTYDGINSSTGLYQVKDFDSNGVFDDADKTFILHTDRKYYGGISNSFRYKAFQMSFLFQFARGNSQEYNSGAAAGGIVNQSTRVKDRWMNSGDKSEYQKYSQNFSAFVSNVMFEQSNASFVDGSFCVLKLCQSLTHCHNLYYRG